MNHRTLGARVTTRFSMLCAIAASVALVSGCESAGWTRTSCEAPTVVLHPDRGSVATSAIAAAPDVN